MLGIKDKYDVLVRPSAGPVCDPVVEEAYRSIPFNDIINYERDTAVIDVFKQRYWDWINNSELNSINWPQDLKPYVTQAVTQSIESFLFLHRNRRIRTLPGEYMAVSNLAQRFELNWSEIEDASSPDFEAGDCFMLSAPFSASGDVHPQMTRLLEAANDKRVPTFIDCAFWGLCYDIQLNLNYECIETVAFSLSKSFRIGLVRIGIEFSKNVSPTIGLVNERSYLNRHGAVIACYLLKKFSADYIANKYRDLQREICLELDAQPSKTIIFGLGGSQKYEHWDRGGGFRRLCFNNSLAHRISLKNDEKTISRV